MGELNGPLGWEQRSMHALAVARRNKSPSKTLCSMLRDGHLKIPEAHYTLNDEPQTQGCHLSICGVHFNDESFEREYKMVIERLCLSLLRQLVTRHNTTTSVALTILARDLRENSISDKTALDAVQAMMSESNAPSSTSTAGNPNFPYRPLPQDGTSIRLLVLLPSEPDAQIMCKLAHTSLIDGTKYEALSYVWGATTDTVNIFVDDRKFPVNTNLFEALKALRQSSEPRVIWADAICIDQNNVLERSSQVAIMGRIYRQAARVVAWPGLEPEEQKIVFKTLNGDREIPEKFLPALASFMNNVYFQRAWIVQEVTLAQDVLFQYGTSSCPLQNLVHYISPNEQVSGHSRSRGVPKDVLRGGVFDGQGGKGQGQRRAERRWRAQRRAEKRRIGGLGVERASKEEDKGRRGIVRSGGRAREFHLRIMMYDGLSSRQD